MFITDKREVLEIWKITGLTKNNFRLSDVFSMEICCLLKRQD